MYSNITGGYINTPDTYGGITYCIKKPLGMDNLCLLSVIIQFLVLKNEIYIRSGSNPELGNTVYLKSI